MIKYERWVPRDSLEGQFLAHSTLKEAAERFGGEGGGSAKIEGCTLDIIELFIRSNEKAQRDKWEEPE